MDPAYGEVQRPESESESESESNPAWIGADLTRQQVT